MQFAACGDNTNNVSPESKEKTKDPCPWSQTEVLRLTIFAVSTREQETWYVSLRQGVAASI